MSYDKRKVILSKLAENAEQMEKLLKECYDLMNNYTNDLKNEVQTTHKIDFKEEIQYLCLNTQLIDMVVPFKTFKQTSEKSKEEWHDEIKEQMPPQMFLRMLKIEALARAKERGALTTECIPVDKTDMTREEAQKEEFKRTFDIDSKLN